MNTQTLTLLAIDVRGIQRYIFGSNKLKHNVGASEIVHRATHHTLRQYLQGPNNLTLTLGDLDTKVVNSGDAFERGELAAEVVFAGGGNALILFHDKAKAQSFVQAYSRDLLRHAPGLVPVIRLKADVTVDWDQPDALRNVVNQLLREDLDIKKRSQPAPRGLLGLGVTADCQYTGLPAVALDRQDEFRRVSAEIQAKQAHFIHGDQRLNAICPLHPYQYVMDFDDLGVKGESSYMAVVHADGNRMGQAFQDVGRGLPARGYISAYGMLSERVNEIGTQALRATIEGMKASVDQGILKLRNNTLPIRPIVFGGDDSTFVCDGRLGLILAALYVAEFAKQRLPDGTLATARAGVMIVKSHYPFARAYDLAEELAKSAKARLSGDNSASALDWHFGVDGVVLPIGEIRERDYRSDDGNRLLMRPLVLRASSDGWRDWASFSALMTQFQQPEWTERRNKVKALRQALRKGKQAVNRFCTQFELTLPQVGSRSDAHTEGGFIGGYNAYFDAIEAMDFFAPLTRPVQDARAEQPTTPEVRI